ncbi:MAG: LuxR C-terminal-related transcriptional regulator [Planctomycetaceae bacterium]
MPFRPTLFIAHRQELLLAGFVAMVGDLDLRVAGVASDAARAVEGVCETGPGVALVDCLLPGDGFAATRRLADAAPNTRVIVVSPSGDTNHLARARASHAVNCVAEEVSRQGLGAAIAMAAAGHRPAPPDPFAVVSARLESTAPSGADAHLTRRERQVLRHLAYGLDNSEIAAALSIGLETVKTHVHKLLRRMELRDRTQAAVWAVKHGLA